MRILIRHPEGNFNNNPGLLALTKFLADRGDNVDIWSPPHEIYQSSPYERVQVLLKGRRVVRIAEEIKPKWLGRLLAILFFRVYFRQPVPDLVIGVDREGIIDASVFAEVFRVPYGMISYEIMFADETSDDFKRIERDACRRVAFCICQDELRSAHLARENAIDGHKIVNIPVAGSGIKNRSRSPKLCNMLNISLSSRIVIFAGSLASWTLIEDLAAAAIHWPEPWVLVIHGRYGIGTDWENKLCNALGSGKVFLSKSSFDAAEDFSELLSGADIGIALYRPDFTHPYTGNNLKYIGLSSGKLSTYLQHGLPVIVNEIGAFSDLVDEYQAGFVVASAESVGQVLGSMDDRALQRASENAHTLFEQRIDAERYKHVFLAAVDDAVSCQPA